MSVNFGQILEQWRRDFEAFINAVGRGFEELSRLNLGFTRPFDPVVDFFKRKLESWGVAGVGQLATEDISISVGTKLAGVGSIAVTHFLLKEPLASIMQGLGGVIINVVAIASPIGTITSRIRSELMEFGNFLLASLAAKWLDQSVWKGMIKEIKEVSAAKSPLEWLDKAIKDFEEVSKDFQTWVQNISATLTGKVTEVSEGEVEVIEALTESEVVPSKTEIHVVPQYEIEVRPREEVYTTHEESGVKVEEVKVEEIPKTKTEEVSIEEVEVTESPEVSITVVSKPEEKKVPKPRILAEGL